MSQQEIEYAKANGVSPKTMAARKSVVRAFADFQDKCVEIDHSRWMDHFSAVFSVMSRCIPDYLKVYDFAADARLVPLMYSTLSKLFYVGTKGAVARVKGYTYYICIGIDNHEYPGTFYYGHSSASMPNPTSSSGMLIVPNPLADPHKTKYQSLWGHPTFWQGVVDLVRIHGRLDYDYDYKTVRAVKNWPVYWGCPHDPDAMTVRYSFLNPDMSVLCYDHDKLTKKYEVPKPLILTEPAPKCYYVVDFHHNDTNVVSHVNIWFKGPRHMYGSSYYNRLMNNHQDYDTLTLVNSVNIAKFHVRLDSDPLVCFYAL